MRIPNPQHDFFDLVVLNGVLEWVALDEDVDVQNEAEVLMIAKTTRSAYTRLETWLIDHHPYDVPEVLALPVRRGSAAYLGWLADEIES